MCVICCVLSFLHELSFSATGFSDLLYRLYASSPKILN